MHERVQQHVINLTGVKLPERNRGTTARSNGFDFIVGKGERERERRRLFKQKEIQKGREEGREGAHRGNDFPSLSLSLSLPVASKRENVISIRHTCHEKVERRERERE